jgi:hypothetical protein
VEAGGQAGPAVALDQVGEGLDRDLDPGQVAVVADPQLGQAEGAEQGLGPLDPRQPGRGDLDAVGDPGGQAGRGRLVGAATPP